MNIETRVYEIIKNQIPHDSTFHTLLKDACEKCPISDVVEHEAHSVASFVLSIVERKRVLSDKISRSYNVVAFICAAWMKDRPAIDFMMLNTLSDKEMIRHFVCLVFASNGLIKNVNDITSTVHPKIPDIVLFTTCALIAGGSGNQDLIHSLWKYEPYLLNYCLKGAFAAKNTEALELIKMIGNEYCDYEDALMETESVCQTVALNDGPVGSSSFLFFFVTIAYSIMLFILFDGS